MVIVVAEGAGQDLIAESLRSMHNEDLSGNKLLLDVGLWLSQKIKVGSKIFLNVKTEFSSSASSIWICSYAFINSKQAVITFL